jgi:hypothetical protein
MAAELAEDRQPDHRLKPSHTSRQVPPKLQQVPGLFERNWHTSQPAKLQAFAYLRAIQSGEVQPELLPSMQLAEDWSEQLSKQSPSSKATWDMGLGLVDRTLALLERLAKLVPKAFTDVVAQQSQQHQQPLLVFEAALLPQLPLDTSQVVDRLTDIAAAKPMCIPWCRESIKQLSSSNQLSGISVQHQRGYLALSLHNRRPGLTDKQQGKVSRVSSRKMVVEYAHRLICWARWGPPPSTPPPHGKQWDVMHTCGNGWCIAPWHHVYGSHSLNVLEGLRGV